MKYYNVKVNGSVYRVEVEEVSGEEQKPLETQHVQQHAVIQPEIRQPDIQPAAVKPQPQPSPKAAPVSGKSKRIECPMAGKIMDIKVKTGETVKVNQIVVILEAMKMENEVVTPYGGTVAEINVTVGQNVNTGDTLVTIN